MQLIKDSTVAFKYCDDCGITHTSLMCLRKPRHFMRTVSEKTLDRRGQTKREWLRLNPPDERGTWTCYLQISSACPIKLTASTLNLEHVKSKARYPELRYDLNNIKPACSPCNKLKGSRDVEEL